MSDLKVVRLLVVEDSKAYLYLIRKAFAERTETVRWDLTFAEDGAQAVALLFSEERKSDPVPDLILLDWNLPKISGNEVLRRLKTHQRLRRIPVLIFSSSDADEDVHAAYDSHANGYITKPASAEILANIVGTIEKFWIAIAELPRLATEFQSRAAH